MNDLADVVRHERLKRGWSVREAARAGNISNTYWGGFEDYRQPLTPTITAAVALAYGWSDKWADEAMKPVRLESVVGLLEGMDETTDAAVLRFEEISDQLAAIEVRLAALEGKSLGFEQPPP